MAWSYEGDPSASSKDAVRWLAGDTDPAVKLVSDEEIAYAISYTGTVHGAAAEVARSIASIYAREVDKQVGDLKISASQKSKQYHRLALSLRRRANLAVGGYAGGISQSDVETRRDDTDRVEEQFRVGLFDFPGTSPSSLSTST